MSSSMLLGPNFNTFSQQAQVDSSKMALWEKVGGKRYEEVNSALNCGENCRVQPLPAPTRISGHNILKRFSI